MKEKSYIIPKNSRLFTAAAICMALNFAMQTVTQAVQLKSHIPFFGNLVGDTHGFFGILLTEDVLFFAWYVLELAGTLLARKNLWILSAGWLCALALQIFQYFTAYGGGAAIGFYVCCIATLFLAQTGEIHSRKAAVIPAAACGAVNLALTLPSALHYGKETMLYSAANILRYVSLGLLMAAMMWKTNAAAMPAAIVRTVNDNETE